MANKTKEMVEQERVESAIRSLYHRFEKPSGCRRVKTLVSVDLLRQIKKRETELAADKKLSDLQKKLAEERRKVLERCTAMHGKIDNLLSQFRVRGVTPKLLDTIEAVSNEPPVVFVDDCE